MKSFTRQPGFTLIEILLVVVIMAIIAVFGLNYYQQRLTTQKLHSAAQQIQQIQQAGGAYYVDNTCWPTDPNCPQNVPNFSSYLPTPMTNNPWGNPYTYQLDPAYGKKFQVITALPSAILASRLAALLPSAIINPQNNTQIISEISVPSGQVKQLFNIQIASITYSGSKSDGDAGAFSFSCPAGWSGQGVIIPVRIDAIDWDFNPLNLCAGVGSYIISKLYPANDSVACSNSGNSVNCSYQVVSQSNVTQGIGCRWETVNTGAVSFAQIGYCINPNTTSSAKLF